MTSLTSVVTRKELEVARAKEKEADLKKAIREKQTDDWKEAIEALRTKNK